MNSRGVKTWCVQKQLPVAEPMRDRRLERKLSPGKLVKVNDADQGKLLGIKLAECDEAIGQNASAEAAAAIEDNGLS